ncbi:3-oxoadipate enol-lactonase [Nocardiopsis lambiniae]|uniref:3-oxoadipate enol-lactonase n=1 Tax=Nocardiopsis lambiniae TaxID=3075539 RepID=A0ABU2MC20_9ACTN|nr:3-oxoadipate enol-lactonase [Nocardiopsis sp. DSM 44743]MDT0330144.1 3-oxoadipate enol-lactonase [Nocardiopsis sp. DSM 44743]
MSVDLHHVESGPADAPPLLLGGSLGTTTAMWAPQVAALSTVFRVIRFDHRGHGGSPIPPGPYGMADLAGDVVALLDRLGIERAHYAGLSIGGMVGQWLAVHHADRLDRLALLATSPHAGPAGPWRERAALVRAQGTGAVADTVVSRWFTPGFAAEHPHDVTVLRDQIAATSPEGYAGCCEAVAGHDVREDLAGVTTPTLVIAGAEDPATPPAAHANVIAERVPGACLVTLTDAAHLLSWQRPDEVNALLTRHFSTGAGE